ncbi:MarR family transcriptional regulator [Actinoplanes sp. ATCC 53533]|uniref:MarR family winged helix-turn-helix transcriptional regulator n=1 Tax=Actinoplanes sp. ATCC 53533 TaxID=1288362 RepID=UPI000F78523F|nr:MarR family winged helix-turn-helix transcriptional regulator [Actinoplanes sp. ATCC 53533]RSM59451.1 MarR family transcriptional regulator [Actinoplanes sp. ATCC 53533]
MEWNEPLAAIERAMITIRRSQSRRALSRLTPPGDQTVFGVLDALEEIGRPATVGEVGAATGVDQPRASRLVGRAVDQGLVVRQADQSDGRRTLLALTGEGQAHLAAAHHSRQQVFARAMANWPAEDTAAFARLLTSFTTSLGALTSQPD